MCKYCTSVGTYTMFCRQCGSMIKICSYWECSGKYDADNTQCWGHTVKTLITKTLQEV